MGHIKPYQRKNGTWVQSHYRRQDKKQINFDNVPRPDPNGCKDLVWGFSVIVLLVVLITNGCN